MRARDCSHRDSDIACQGAASCRGACASAAAQAEVSCRLSRNHWAKALALVWVILAMIYIGGLGIYAVSGQPLHESFWEVRLPDHSSFLCVWVRARSILAGLPGACSPCSHLSMSAAGL